MKLSKLLNNARTPFGVSDKLKDLEIIMDSEVCLYSFYPWLIEDGETTFKKLDSDYDAFYAKYGIPYLKVFKNLSNNYDIVFCKYD